MQNQMLEKQEKIGKITLDYTLYPGQDFYSDGAIEDELLETVKNHPEEEKPFPLFSSFSIFLRKISLPRKSISITILPKPSRTPSPRFLCGI